MPTVHISLGPHAAEKLPGKKLSARNNSQNRFLAALVEQTFGIGLTQMKLHCELPQLGLKSLHFSQVPSAFPGRLSRVLSCVEFFRGFPSYVVFLLFSKAVLGCALSVLGH